MTNDLDSLVADLRTIGLTTISLHRTFLLAQQLGSLDRLLTATCVALYSIRGISVNTAHEVRRVVYQKAFVSRLRALNDERKLNTPLSSEVLDQHEVNLRLIDEGLLNLKLVDFINASYQCVGQFIDALDVFKKIKQNTTHINHYSFPTVEDLLLASESDLFNVPSVGEQTAKRVYEGLRDPKTIRTLRYLKARGALDVSEETLTSLETYNDHPTLLPI